MKIEQIKDIRIDISQNRVKVAMDKLFTIISEYDAHNSLMHDIIKLQARHTRLETKISRGIINNVDATTEMNQITDSLLNYVNNIDELLQKKPIVDTQPTLERNPLHATADVNSNNYDLYQRESPFFKEEVFVSVACAITLGINQSFGHAIFAAEQMFPNMPSREYAVRVVVDNSIFNKNIYINKHLFQQIEDTHSWTLTKCAYYPAQKIVLEQVMETLSIEKNVNDIRRNKKEFLVGRCFLAQNGVAESSILYVNSIAFRINTFSPAINGKGIIGIQDSTEIDIFVPHSKMGIDMVILIDASGSMQLRDYEDKSNSRLLKRLEGVKMAMKEFLKKRMILSNSRVSKLAIMLFGNNTFMCYPPNERKLIETSKSDIENIDRLINAYLSLSHEGLNRYLDTTGTKISTAMRDAVEIFNLYSDDNKEKMIILLSDGADWQQENQDTSGEIISTFQDPAALADRLYNDSKIRIHTIAISNEVALNKYEPAYSKNHLFIPNKILLQKIAGSTDALFVESADATALTQLFNLLGGGSFYPT